MFKTIKQAIIGSQQQQKKSNDEEIKQNSEIKKENKFDKASTFIGNFFSQLYKELFVAKFKLQNLANANHKLGFKHLKNGNISDATFRFKFIKKFWPQNYDARYALAYCYAISDNYANAKIELNAIQAENPDYQNKIEKLLNAIKTAQSTNQEIIFDLDEVIDTNPEFKTPQELETEEDLSHHNEDKENLKKIVKILNDDENANENK